MQLNGLNFQFTIYSLYITRGSWLKHLHSLWYMYCIHAVPKRHIPWTQNRDKQKVNSQWFVIKMLSRHLPSQCGYNRHSPPERWSYRIISRRWMPFMHTYTGRWQQHCKGYSKVTGKTNKSTLCKVPILCHMNHIDVTFDDACHTVKYYKWLNCTWALIKVIWRFAKQLHGQCWVRSIKSGDWQLGLTIPCRKTYNTEQVYEAW
jgi:hypothetical protein